MLNALCPCFRRRRFGRYSSAAAAAARQHDISLNMILHGECSVGKTSLRNRWVDGIFTGDVAPTFGVDFNIKTLDLVQEEDEKEEQGEQKEETESGTTERERRSEAYCDAAGGATAGESHYYQ